MSTYANLNPQAIFYQQYEAVRRDEVVGVLLALFLGSFGLHHFYLKRTGLGILYACFFWSGIPGIIGFFECFFMPGRVRAPATTAVPPRVRRREHGFLPGDRS